MRRGASGALNLSCGQDVRFDQNMPPPASSPTWRILVTPPASGVENMALDEALMDRARATGEWVLRIYSWLAPTLSFGRNQTALGRYDIERIRDRGLDVVRRPTGGRSILHHREITYSVTAPLADSGDLRESYNRINGILMGGLRRLGVQVRMAGRTSRASLPGAAPCFDEPAEGELMLGTRKLAGSAQWRADGALLQHGSILTHDDQSSLVELMVDARNGIAPPATLAEVLANVPSPATFAEALAASIEDAEDMRPLDLVLDDAVRARTAALVVRYLDAAWTWRR